MFNRIRVVTMLMMVLGVFALLQLVSGGLLFSSLQQNQQSFVISNDLRQQQSELTSTWDLMLQTHYQFKPFFCSHDDGRVQPAKQREKRSAEECESIVGAGRNTLRKI